MSKVDKLNKMLEKQKSKINEQEAYKVAISLGRVFSKGENTSRTKSLGHSIKYNGIKFQFYCSGDYGIVYKSESFGFDAAKAILRKIDFGNVSKNFKIVSVGIEDRDVLEVTK